MRQLLFPLVAVTRTEQGADYYISRFGSMCNSLASALPGKTQFLAAIASKSSCSSWQIKY